MPNPSHIQSRGDLPLDEAVGFATRVFITCMPPVSSTPCGHRAIERTEELYAKLPQCRTYREFSERLYCSRCKRRGWVSIEPATR